MRPHNPDLYQVAGQLGSVVGGVADNDHVLLAAQAGDWLIAGVDRVHLAAADGRDALPADEGHHVLLPGDDEDTALLGALTCTVFHVPPLPDLNNLPNFLHQLLH